MAETSGFFDAEELVDGGYDREYLAEQWANYFKLFVGNGVFATPTNQLKVRANSGLNLKIMPGWAWINGYWYHNDSELSITVPANVTSAPVTDGIFIRFDSANRIIDAHVAAGRTTVDRVAPYYELKIAEVVVGVGATELTDANITDTRANSSVCGFVTGLINVIDSTDLFAQYQAIFNEFIAAATSEENNFVIDRNAEQSAYESARNAEYAAWKQDVEDDHSTWETNYQAEAASFRQDAESDHNDWENDFQDDAETWQNSFQSTLEAWFSNMQGQISSDAAVNLQNQIDSLKYMYVQDGILYLPNTRASVTNGILTISTT